MATLQKLRDRGPLLVGFVGLALFAFIASDAWRALAPNNADFVAGYFDDEKVSAIDFQDFQNDFIDAQRVLRAQNENLPEASRNASFTDDELESIKETAWNTYVQLETAKRQGEKLGITVTPDEIEHVLSNNLSQFLNNLNSQFKSQLIVFDAESWKEIDNSYKKGLEIGRIDPYTAEMHKCWDYVINNITIELLQTKQNALYTASAIANPALAGKNFDLNNNTFSIELAAYPYNEIADSLVNVTDKDVENYYNSNKEYLYKQNIDTRDIKFITTKILPSSKDRNLAQAEMQEYADSLKAGCTDYGKLLRMAGCEYTYNDMLWTKDAFSEDVQVRIENAAINEVVGPYAYTQDNTFNVFKPLRKEEVADSMMIRLILIESQSADELKATTDSLMDALKKKADFKELAKNYGSVDSLWFRASDFFRVGIFFNVKTQEEVYNAPKGKYATVELSPNANMIYQVIDKKGKAEVYNIAFIKKEIETSSETYNNKYNKLSEFVASCSNIEQFTNEASKNGFFTRTMNDVNASTKRINNLPNTSNIIRWILSDERVAGEFSPIEECGNNDHFIVAAIESVNPKGYAPLSKVAPSIKNTLTTDKKVEMIKNELSGKDFKAICGNNKVKFSTINMVEYKKPTHVSVLNADEPAISAAVANLNVGDVTAPIKGLNAVYVAKVVSKDAKKGEFNAETESEYILSNGGMLQYQWAASQLMNAALMDIYPSENKLHTLQQAR